MRKLLAVAVAFALCAGAYADITEYLDSYQAAVTPGDDFLHPDFNDGTYYTIDLRVVVDEDCDAWMWTSSHAEASIDAGVYFEHMLGGDGPSTCALVNLYPAAEYDSFFCAADTTIDDPNDPNQPTGNCPNYLFPSFAERSFSDQYRMATWFDTPPNEGCGDWLIARYTVHLTEGTATFHVVGEHTTYGGGGTLYPFDLMTVIPEPASLALLGLGLTLIRRR